jgi:hypothetical protein
MSKLSLMIGYVLSLPVSEFYFVSYWLLAYEFQLLLAGDGFGINSTYLSRL